MGLNWTCARAALGSTDASSGGGGMKTVFYSGIHEQKWMVASPGRARPEATCMAFIAAAGTTHPQQQQAAAAIAASSLFLGPMAA